MIKGLKCKTLNVYKRDMQGKLIELLASTRYDVNTFIIVVGGGGRSFRLNQSSNKPFLGNCFRELIKFITKDWFEFVVWHPSLFRS